MLLNVLPVLSREAMFSSWIVLHNALFKIHNKKGKEKLKSRRAICSREKSLRNFEKFCFVELVFRTGNYSIKNFPPTNQRTSFT